MGFLDKLRDSVTKAVETVQSNFVPLSDETERKYYEIAYGLLASVEMASCDAIKKYIEHHVGQTCDEEKLQTIISYMDHYGSKRYRIAETATLQSRVHNKGYTPQKVEKLIEINKTLENSKNYRCTKEEFYNICYKDVVETLNTIKTYSCVQFSAELERLYEKHKTVIGEEILRELVEFYCCDNVFGMVKAECSNVLNVVDEHGVQHFRDGVNRIIKKLNKYISEDIIRNQICTITSDMFFEGHEIVTFVIFAYFEVFFTYKDKRELLNPDSKIEVVASTAIRALRFEKYSQNPESYPPLTEDECRKFVLNNATFKAKIEKHPYDMEEYTNKFTSSVMKYDCFGFFNDFWMPSAKHNPYYTDKLCHYFVQEISKNYNNVEPENPNYIFNMLMHYIDEAE